MFSIIFSKFLSTTTILLLKQNKPRIYNVVSSKKMSGLPKENLTAVLCGINDLRLEQKPIPKPKDNQVLLKMEVVGICGSDVHYLQHGKIGPFVVEAPMVIGHEASGTVVECGKNVRNLKPGDHVAIEPGIPCRRCRNCKTGRYNLCPYMAFCATPPYDGNLARYYVHDDDFCYKLPSNMDFEDGSLMEPLSVGVHACKKGGVGIGDSVLIFGAGPIGLVTLLVAKAFGASNIFVTDMLSVKVTKAKELGADHVLRTCEDMKTEDLVKIILDTLGRMPDVTIDCCGSDQAYKVGMKVTKSGGTLVAVGMAMDYAKLPVPDCVMREVNVVGCFRYCNDYPTAIELVGSGKVCVKPLITHHFKMEDTLKAFETAITKEGDPIKILIHANPEWQPPSEKCC